MRTSRKGDVAEWQRIKMGRWNTYVDDETPSQVRAAAAVGPNQASGPPAAVRARAAVCPARPPLPGGHGPAYGLFAKLAKMRRVNPFSTAMSADEKSRIARR
jgi:hypothetical protein